MNNLRGVNFSDGSKWVATWETLRHAEDSSQTTKIFRSDCLYFDCGGEESIERAHQPIGAAFGR